MTTQSIHELTEQLEQVTLGSGLAFPQESMEIKRQETRPDTNFF